MTVSATFYVGDVFDRMAEMLDDSVDLVLTSPPFLALRSYLPADHPDKGKEIGTEPTPADFLDTLLALTAEWRRIVKPTGSIAVELGDTYSGSGGAGGDYNSGGVREGQTRFDGSASRAYGTGAAPRPPRTGRSRDWARNPVNPSTRRHRPGWPMDKSLCGIPHLYHLSLAYGRNMLTGAESKAGHWRIRNVVAWCRPNPPVGRLGDKFRPATSYLTIACTERERYFDLDAVRKPVPATDNASIADDAARYEAPGQPRRNTRARALDGKRIYANPKGAPPLDWWEIPTQPFKGSHYATWPERLLERPILTMVPEGGTVFDPFAGSGTTLAVATRLGRNAIGIDIDARNVDLARQRVDGPLWVHDWSSS